MSPAPKFKLTQRPTPAPFHNKALPIGSRLREWRLESILGVGGFGIVYRAKGVYFNEIVAIKEYFPGAISDRLGDTTVAPTTSSAEQLYALAARFDAFFKLESLLRQQVSTGTQD
jgi:serine/threonine protein kinase